MASSSNKITHPLMPVDWLKIKNRDGLFLVDFTTKKNHSSRLLHSRSPFFMCRVSWSRNSKTTLTKKSQAYLILCPTVIMEL
uniref:Uncharacterized protein n=1 Tax=Caenorhabditis japonica TaxID=281687 RepID=A0A8R1IJD5_CAEJA